MPLSIKTSLSPSSTNRQRIAQVQRLFSSAGLVLDQSDFGTTPNMAPPSSLKNPVLMTCNFIVNLGIKNPTNPESNQFWKDAQQALWDSKFFYSSTTPIAQNFSILCSIRTSGSILSNSFNAAKMVALRVLAMVCMSL
jgi:hypothetical protein